MFIFLFLNKQICIYVILYMTHDIWYMNSWLHFAFLLYIHHFTFFSCSNVHIGLSLNRRSCLMIWWQLLFVFGDTNRGESVVFDLSLGPVGNCGLNRLGILQAETHIDLVEMKTRYDTWNLVKHGKDVIYRQISLDYILKICPKILHPLTAKFQPSTVVSES